MRAERVSPRSWPHRGKKPTGVPKRFTPEYDQSKSAYPTRKWQALPGRPRGSPAGTSNGTDASYQYERRHLVAVCVGLLSPLPTFCSGGNTEASVCPCRGSWRITFEDPVTDCNTVIGWRRRVIETRDWRISRSGPVSVEEGDGWLGKKFGADPSTGRTEYGVVYGVPEALL